METVHEISPDLLADPGLSVGITIQSIVACKRRRESYEVFAGNRTDVTTVEEIVEQMEERYGLPSACG
jgi:hypothetical protein